MPEAMIHQSDAIEVNATGTSDRCAHALQRQSPCQLPATPTAENIPLCSVNLASAHLHGHASSHYQAAVHVSCFSTPPIRPQKAVADSSANRACCKGDSCNTVIQPRQQHLRHHYYDCQ